MSAEPFYRAQRYPECGEPTEGGGRCRRAPVPHGATEAGGAYNPLGFCGEHMEKRAEMLGVRAGVWPVLRVDGGVGRWRT